MAGNLLLDSNHDIIVGRTFTRTSGVELVAQSAKCNLLAVLGEWKLDKNLGIPWFDGVFRKGVSLADVETLVANVIRKTDGVLSLVSVTVTADFTERTVDIDFVAASVYGEVTGGTSWPTNMG